MSEAERPDEPRPNAPRRRRASRPAGPGENRPSTAGESGRGTQSDQGAQRSRSNQAGKDEQRNHSGQSGEGRARQGRRRRRGGRGRRRGGRGQGNTPETRRPGTEGESTDGGSSTRTVRSGDGTAGATSSGRQTPRHPRRSNRSRSGGGQPSATTRTSKPGKPGAKAGNKPGGSPAGRAGGKQGGSKSGAKPGGGKPGGGKNTKNNPRGGRGGGRHPRGGQRLRTVLETSAGGMVVRGLARSAEGSDVDLSRLEVALIGRLDRRSRMLWSMPKGHIEPGETVEETARREVLEETGVDGTVLAPLGTIDYWFVAEGRRIHKTVHHHLIRYDHGDLCDEDPEITEVAWVGFADLPKRLAYPDERKLVEAARSLLPALAHAETAGENPAALPAQLVDPTRRAQAPTSGGAQAPTGDGAGSLTEDGKTEESGP